MRLGFTSVVGDLFHAGHVAMIQECRRNCDYLIVAIMADTHDRIGKNKPVQSLFERSYQVACCKGVDMIVACESEKDLELAIRTIKPDVRFVGSDYVGKDFTGKDYCLQNGVELQYNNRTHGLSSTELRERITNGI